MKFFFLTQLFLALTKLESKSQAEDFFFLEEELFELRCNYMMSPFPIYTQ